LHSFEPKVGDVVYIPAGTVHALGAGLVILEIQQASDTTFRLYDWNRVGKDGQPRPLHIEKALEVIDFNRGPVEPIRIASASGNDELVKSPYFELRRIKQAKSFSIEEQSLCRMWTVIEGAMQINGEPSGDILTAGQTVLIPASWSTIEVRVHEPVTILEATLP
jgi:mannose-6-phosphate isomerase